MPAEVHSSNTFYADLQQALGYRFSNLELLRVAVTHRSYSNEMGEKENYERLEFLGDAVLGLVTAHWLYRTYPGRPEGRLAKLKSYLVSAPVLSRFAAAISLGDWLHLGVGEERSGGRAKASILADATESLFGAIYLDGGLEAARQVICPILEAAVVQRAKLPHSDAKTQLQELVQARGWGLPKYRLVESVGPDHCKTFTVDCWVDNQPVSIAAGTSKKQAEQRAAALAIEQLDLLSGEP